MTRQLSNIKQLIDQGEIEQAIDMLTTFTQADNNSADEAYYLLGNAYRKKGDWQQALNNYMEAVERNPESPAVEARNALIDILNFYNKDMYNQ